MKRYIAVGSILVIMLSIITACGTSSNTPVGEISQNSMESSAWNSYVGTAETLADSEQVLYDSTVKKLLEEDLWTARDRYDAAHNLMIPMYYAFWAEDTEAIKCFAEFFQRFTDDVCGEDLYAFAEDALLNRAQFLYLSSQFACLCAANEQEELIPDGLLTYCQTTAEEVLDYYNPNYGQTLEEHMEYVLAGNSYVYPWWGAISDLEQYGLAILSDLYVVYQMTGEKKAEGVAYAPELAYRIFSSPLLNQETEKGGWLFQPGVMAEHPNYIYAGNVEIAVGMEPAIIENLGADTSHSQRLPLMLRSYYAAQQEPAKKELFCRRLEQLGTQMTEYVLQKRDGKWVVSTYLDGRNGVYRYKPETGRGYSGHQLSGTLLVGWWSLLENEEIKDCYDEILSYFPLTANIYENPYFDPATTREQNPFFDMDTGFELGMFECIVMCASKLYG